jgi:hypothetical protein
MRGSCWLEVNPISHVRKLGGGGEGIILKHEVMNTSLFHLLS